ncbi:MAG TPA: AsmA family protein, partial [Steroidobacteraceae bacterium]
FFPWLALRMGAGTLANAPGVSGDPLARWQQARIAARLLPLLRGELVIGRVRVDGLAVHLARDAGGHGNWADLGGTGPSSGSLALEQIAGIELRDGSLDFTDARSGASYQLRHVQLQTGPWRRGAPFDIKLALASQPSASLPQATLALVTRISRTGDTIRLAHTSFAGRLWYAPLPSEGLEFALESAEVQGDVRGGSITTPAWTLRTAGATVHGMTDARLGAAGPAGATQGSLEIRGNATLERASLRTVLAKLGITAPPTRDPAALGAVDLTCRYAVSGQNLRVTALALHLDRTVLTGEASRALGADAVLEFALHGDQMDLTGYLKPEGLKSEPFELPTAALRALRARGTLDLDAARLGEMQLKAVRISLLLDETGLHPAAALPPAKP